MTLPLYMLVQRATSLLAAHEPPEGYVGAFSGGKDSVAIKELARLAGVKVEWNYYNTTIDPPELVRFVREHHPDVISIQPKHGFLLHRALTKGFPSRQSRWCCEEYKERAYPGRTLILGVRIAESHGRARNWTDCRMTTRDGQRVALPIRLWSDTDVWAFIRAHKLPYCSLYDEGFARLGCVGCPLTSRRQKFVEFARWPRMAAAWQRMFERLWANKVGTLDRNGNEWWGSRHHDAADELWRWWRDGQKNVSEWRATTGLRLKVPPQ